MKIFEKIKAFFKIRANKTPLIDTPKEVIEEESEKIPDGFIAPKGTREEDSIETFAQSLQVSEKEKSEVPVSFEKLEDKKVHQLLGRIDEMGAGLGWTHNNNPTICGKINGKSFATIKRRNVDYRQGEMGQTICTDNGYYDIKTFGNNSTEGLYKEVLTQEDGTEIHFETRLDADNDDIHSVISKNGISLTEIARMSVTHGGIEREFEKYAQPSKDLTKEYAEATGLPIIMDDLCKTMRKEDERCVFPYIISIMASKKIDDEAKPIEKVIKYAYTSPEAYRNGEKPYMIYMDGIDGRTGFSGMFRLKGDSYIDNSTFRRENGEYKYDTIDYDEIMELAGKMPTKLSERANSAITRGFRMPPEIQEIYNKAISIELGKENPSQGVEIS